MFTKGIYTLPLTLRRDIFVSDMILFSDYFQGSRIKKNKFYLCILAYL